MNIKTLTTSAIILIALTFTGCKDGANTPNLDNNPSKDNNQSKESNSTECIDLKGVWTTDVDPSKEPENNISIKSNCSFSSGYKDGILTIIDNGIIVKHGNKILNINDINSTKIELTFNYTDSLKTIYYINNNNLSFGSPQDLDIDGYPESLSNDIYYKK